MKIILAPDKFKGSLSGLEFCRAVREGLEGLRPKPEIIDLPLADGGDGTIEVVRHYLKAETITTEVNDPLFRPITASYVVSPDKTIAFIEMAEASGLRLLKTGEINCMNTTSLGTGELIVDAIEKGATEIILGIGGSATNDAGMGMAMALGYRFLDSNDREIKPVGANLNDLYRIDTKNVHPGLKDVTFKTACDVKNPLYGRDGAAYIYAEQKGASALEIAMLDDGLRNFASVVKKEFNIDLQQIKGAGAAGGLGAAAVVFLNSSLVPGIDLIKEMADFDTAINGADWIITGEGKLDEQTLSGKTIQGVLATARAKGIPVAAFCGAVALPKGKAAEMGLTYIAGVSDGEPDMERAFKNAFENVKKAALEFGRSLL